MPKILARYNGGSTLQTGVIDSSLSENPGLITATSSVTNVDSELVGKYNFFYVTSTGSSQSILFPKLDQTIFYYVHNVSANSITVDFFDADGNSSYTLPGRGLLTITRNRDDIPGGAYFGNITSNDAQGGGA